MTRETQPEATTGYKNNYIPQSLRGLMFHISALHIPGRRQHFPVAPAGNALSPVPGLGEAGLRESRLAGC